MNIQEITAAVTACASAAYNVRLVSWHDHARTPHYTSVFFDLDGVGLEEFEIVLKDRSAATAEEIAELIERELCVQGVVELNL